MYRRTPLSPSRVLSFHSFSSRKEQTIKLKEKKGTILKELHRPNIVGTTSKIVRKERHKKLIKNCVLVSKISVCLLGVLG